MALSCQIVQAKVASETMNAALRELALGTKGFMPADEGDALHAAALAACARVPGAAIVEVGTYCGRSTLWLADAVRKAGVVVYAVDHHRGSEENQAGWEWHDPDLVDANGRFDSLPEFRRTVARAGASDVVRALVAESTEVAARWTLPIAVCFIDGGHGRDVARADYEAWAGLVSIGGSLVIHDVFADPKDGGQAPHDEIYLAALRSGRYEEISATGSLRVLHRTR
jgi:predicted O-methyltransferase YrrM